MKKLCLFLCVLMLSFTGCAAPVFETVDDQNDVAAAAVPATLLIQLPEDAAAPAMNGLYGTLYFCDNYEIMVETVAAGNLDGTLRTLTGFGTEKINPLTTVRCGVPCYEGAWSAAGEAGDQVGRILVLDDGKFHYCVSVIGSAEDAAVYAQDWIRLLDSVSLTEG